MAELDNIVVTNEDNTGSLGRVWFIPVEDVLSIPKPVDYVIPSSVVLSTGKNWFRIQLTPDSPGFDDKEVKIKNSKGRSITVAGDVAGHHADLSKLFRNMELRKFLVIAEDSEGNQRLCGSLNNPMRFKFSFDTGNKTSSFKRYSITFFQTCKESPYFYTSPFVEYPGSISPDADMVSLDAYLEAYLNAITTRVETLEDEMDDVQDQLSVISETIDDRVAALLEEGTGITLVYDDDGNALSVAVDLSVFDTDDLDEGSTNLYYTDARADARITAQKGVANGIAPLGADGKIASSYFSAMAITDTYVVSSQAAMLALGSELIPAEKGDVAVRTDLNKSFILKGSNPSVLADWQELLTPTDTVLSVNGFTGVITLTTSHISEGSNLYYTNARGISSTLTGYTSGAGTISSSDTILQAIEKLNGNDVANDALYVKLAGPQNITGIKTFTVAPKFASGIGIQDANGVNLISFPATVSSAVNYIEVTNSASTPIITAKGSTNVNLTIRSSGTGQLALEAGTNGTINFFGAVSAGTFSLAMGNTASANTSNRTGLKLSVFNSVNGSIGPILAGGLSVITAGSETSLFELQTHKAGAFAGRLGLVADNWFMNTTAAAAIASGFGSGAGMMYFGNAATNPSTNISGGFLLWSESAKAKIREDSVNRFIVQAAAATKITAGAPYTNDGYIEIVINGTTYKVMTTA